MDRQMESVVMARSGNDEPPTEMLMDATCFDPEMILSNKWKTKVLIRLRVCAGWSAPLMFVNHQRQGLSRRGPNNDWYLYILYVFEKTFKKN